MNGTITRFELAHLNRALIGFDTLFHDIEHRSQANTVNYPPYNILKHDENTFEIEVAVAGFERRDITVAVDQDQLIIKGHRAVEANPEKYLHRGLAARDFERSWTLADHIQVGDAELTNGILRVILTRLVPEELKPRLIEIK